MDRLKLARAIAARTKPRFIESASVAAFKASDEPKIIQSKQCQLRRKRPLKAAESLRRLPGKLQTSRRGS